MISILIVEDDDFISSVLETKLNKIGYAVEIAKNGEEAMLKITTHKPDLVFLDLIMPGKDGFETLKDIKSNPLTQSIPVVITSNLNQTEDMNRVMDLGAADYIVKSMHSLNDLVEKVPNYLSVKS